MSTSMVRRSITTCNQIVKRQSLPPLKSISPAPWRRTSEISRADISTKSRTLPLKPTSSTSPSSSQVLHPRKTSATRSCGNNANTLDPHRAIRRRSGQRLQMPAMPLVRRRAHEASWLRGRPAPAEVPDELDAVVFWDLRCCGHAGCFGEVAEEGEVG